MYTYTYSQAEPEQHPCKGGNEDSDVSIETLVDQVMREELGLGIRENYESKKESEIDDDEDDINTRLDRNTAVRNGDINIVTEKDFYHRATEDKQRITKDLLSHEVCGVKAGKKILYGSKNCPSCSAYFQPSTHKPMYRVVRGMTKVQSCHSYRPPGKASECMLRADEREKIEGKARSEHILQALAGQVPTPPHPLTVEEVQDICRYRSMMMSSCTGREDDLPPSLVIEVLQVSLHGSSLSLQAAAHLQRVLESRTMQCLHLIPEFRALPVLDQAEVILQNSHALQRFRQALWWDSPSTKYHSSYLVQLLMGEDKLVERGNIPQNLSVKTSSEPFQYSFLFASPCYQSLEEEVLHKSLMKDISDNVDNDDEIEIILIVLIIAFSPDYLDLKDTSQVEKIHQKFVLLLQSHYSGLYPMPVVATKLAKARMIPGITRKIINIMGNRLGL